MREVMCSGFPESFYLGIVTESSDMFAEPPTAGGTWLSGTDGAIWIWTRQSMVDVTIDLHVGYELPPLTGESVSDVMQVWMPAGPLRLDQGPAGSKAIGLSIGAATYDVVGRAHQRAEIAAEVDRLTGLGIGADMLIRDLQRLAGQERYELWLAPS